MGPDYSAVLFAVWDISLGVSESVCSKMRGNLWQEAKAPNKH